ncbi:D-alanyl-D-alanine carboxypeptidase [Komarekiella sp. 'clone 1']|uniref:D-alanyl-D-alanine carboxypeptidase n=1 Tax=Komarekiella delphini-convector SJRDD-AB1 TaxID=2593771 RepID=A0AA40T4C6_9NOST|nr:peptidoglycan-binding protein [Komarekiella delphini-convector]MBD6620711.1 D-alanyl-D-alanine carboxypeptidase [Komarekiella delphini-convector SJRDD-AB1]
MMLKNVKACQTSVANGLSQQIITEMQRIDSTCLVSFSELNVSISTSVFPLLQPPAKEGLRQAIKASGGRKLVVNSAYRTIAQQYLLSRQKQQNRCGRTLVAQPGKSNHESGLALDISDFQIWKPYFVQCGWRWLGAADEVHFDFVRTMRNIRGLSVLSFQRLWNRYNLNDRIIEDGVYGAQTDNRLANSPTEGFGEKDELTANRVLRLSQPLMQGGDVRIVQIALKRAGFNISVDGLFGASTENGVKQFQKQKGLEVDGCVGTATWKALGM